MGEKLRRIYLNLLIPALILFIAAYVLGEGNGQESTAGVSRAVTVIILILSALSSVIAPMWFKIITLRKCIREEKFPDSEGFRIFQKQYMMTAFISVYLIPVSYYLALDKIPLTIIVLLGFYAAYYYYPVEKRVKSEMKIFRVDKSSDEK